MRRLAHLVSALAVAPLVASALTLPAHAAEPPGHVPVWDKGPGGERYVAFGDSFVAGPGISPQRTETGRCTRSERNFPTVVATGLDVNSFVDASCSAATTHHFANRQVAGSYVNAAQLNALSADTTLVTFGTMGGNDIGLVQLGNDCAASATTSCVPAPGTDPYAAAFSEVRDRLVAALDVTKQRSPKAEIYVVGYGTYVPPGGCPATFFDLVSPAEFDYLQSQIDRLSDLLEKIAAEEDVAFVDQRDIPGAIDHTVCAWPDQQWIRGINEFGDGYLMHPSSAGMKAIGDHVLTRVAEERAKAPDPGPTKAQRLAALKAKARTVRAAVTCQQKGRQVRARVTGGRGAVTQVEWKVGARRIGVDRKAPFVLTARAAKVSRVRGTQRLHVTLRDQELKVVRTLQPRRPGCAR
ncbi:SGNH/GDSL hydrolase family protein [Nocardioides daphniae]|uniref:SGNH/GDSL hydrolase family protein n=1 Tax=Nocardioides daphniae TaxID=402297 RepID=A0A4P7UGK3_9ACTN|nr:SGNH/GDSL hydrolase family protein [Nocardioides daphniae]QCC78481.1 SGNH/GDSL hydrolase family protein [Nocardioides daphniae]GGD12054.1 hypothetical protein GCM10007231_08710 [Nocardioides daphniae]